MTGFYYHTNDFSATEIAKKCAKRIEDIPSDVSDATVERRDEVAPDKLFGSKLTEEWVAPNYTDMTVEYDTPYTELNERSQEKEEKRLKQEKGQFFVIEVALTAGNNTYTVSALVEIRGTAAGGKTEFFIEEFRQGAVEIGS